MGIYTYIYIYEAEFCLFICVYLHMYTLTHLKLLRVSVPSKILVSA